MTTNRLLAATAAIAVLAAAPALAQMQSSAPPPSSSEGASPEQASPPASEPSQSEPSTSAPSSSPDTSAAPAAGTPLTKGLTVKDNTGAAIGKITAVETDKSTGGQVATIKMGTDSFSMAATQMQVQNGAAVVNLSKAEITDQLHPGKTKKTPPQ